MDTKAHADARIERTEERGFSLIELLLVVAIIAIVAAIAIPSLLHARRAANSASAVSSLRLIHSSQSSFRQSAGRYGDLSALSPYIGDPLLRQGRKSQYNFTVTPDAALPSDEYTAQATPADPATVTTWRHYFVNATGVLRWNQGASADASSQPISQ
jgi:type IV pilus assembly protein PilA